MTVRDALRRARAATTAAAAAVRRVVGVPDYEAYVRHLRARHPGEKPMSRSEFQRSCWEEKFKRPGSRCC